MKIIVYLCAFKNNGKGHVAVYKVPDTNYMTLNFLDNHSR